MYVRTKSSPRSKNLSVQIVEATRVDGKIKQRVVRHIGTAVPGKELEKLKRLARGILTELHHEALRSLPKASGPCAKDSPFGQLVTVSQGLVLKGEALEESQRVVMGIHDIYGAIYDHIGFSNPFSQPKKRETAANVLRNMVMARIAHPQSKRASVEMLVEQFGIELNLDHVYQMMDKIDERFCERIQCQALATTLQLTQEKLQVLFYDATTLYFESFQEDDLKENGYSKDMKFNQPQVLLALFVTQSGLPVGYDVFPGSTFEGHTLIASLSKLKERYHIDQVVLVADRGMLSAPNLRFLEDNHYRYIVGAKLKSLTKDTQQQILQWVESLSKDTLDGEVTCRITVTPKTTWPVKIFYDPLTEADRHTIQRPTYVLWREQSTWQLAIYYQAQINKPIPLATIRGLAALLASIPEHAQILSRQQKKALTTLIATYHNQPQCLVLAYRPGRALKDRTDRERAIQKLQARLKHSRNPKQLVSTYGFQKFVKVEGEAELLIDQQKLLDEAKWDGVIGIYLSDPTLTNEEALHHYRGLWQVEESFRIQKHDLKIRPIYHWTPQRIKAHIAMAFMAFVCVRYLEYRIATQSKKLSPRVIKNTLLHYQASLIQDTQSHKTYWLPSRVTSDLQEIYRVMGRKLDQRLREVIM